MTILLYCSINDSVFCYTAVLMILYSAITRYMTILLHCRIWLFCYRAYRSIWAVGLCDHHEIKNNDPRYKVILLYDGSVICYVVGPLMTIFLYRSINDSVYIVLYDDPVTSPYNLWWFCYTTIFKLYVIIMLPRYRNRP